MKEQINFMENNSRISFKGLYGSFIKNNYRYNFNIHKPDTALEIIKDSKQYILKFYSDFANENQKIRTVENVQDIFVNEITGNSGLITNSSKNLKIENAIGADSFIDIGKKAKVIIDYMDGGTLYIKNSPFKNWVRAIIKQAKDITIKNSSSDGRQLQVRDAEDLMLLNSKFKNKISINTNNATLEVTENLDLQF